MYRKSKHTFHVPELLKIVQFMECGKILQRRTGHRSQDRP
jgi:hypothetical protein